MESVREQIHRHIVAYVTHANEAKIKRKDMPDYVARRSADAIVNRVLGEQADAKMQLADAIIEIVTPKIYEIAEQESSGNGYDMRQQR